MSNWYVTWNQDTTIIVKDKIETDGYLLGLERGLTGVNPPEEILKNMITIRIHLGDTDEKNGTLKVVPGSHNKRLSDEEIDLTTRSCISFARCELRDTHLMKPFLLHSSSKKLIRNPEE
jgi:hypothetical protein